MKFRICRFCLPVSALSLFLLDSGKEPTWVLSAEP